MTLHFRALAAAALFASGACAVHAQTTDPAAPAPHPRAPKGTQYIPESMGSTRSSSDASSGMETMTRQEAEAAHAEARRACREHGSAQSQRECMKMANEEHRRWMEQHGEGRRPGGSGRDAPMRPQ